MRPDFAARFFDVATRELRSENGCNGCYTCNRPFGYSQKAPELQRLQRLQVKNTGLGKDVFKPATEAVTAPLETVQPGSDARSDSLQALPVGPSLEERRASVALLQDAMAAENERRRGGGANLSRAGARAGW